MRYSFAAALAATVAQASIKVGIVSDLHMMTSYDQWSVDCIPGTAELASEQAPIGRIDCDPSETLVDYLLQRFTEVFGHVDVILVPGDHVAHKVAPHLDESPTK